ncbi:putative glutathione S-transferase [Silene latifolia]|uniref:putative glutathione S-transferase n=1 Tax=Silene latifolia TaxID=37657 RepID=UPI003D76AD00
MEQVKLFGVWGCPFSTRVEIALKLKGIKYEYVKEDMRNKSQELLKYNPITKKIPIFVHNEKPVIETLVIIEYIDEIWKENPLLPINPYERAQTRFWAKFIEEKIGATSSKALPMRGQGTQEAIDELLTQLEIFEKEMKGNKLFKENINKFLDVIGLYVIYWIPILQEVAGKDVFTRDKFPEIYNWADDILNCNIIKDNLPNREKMLTLLRSLN